MTRYYCPRCGSFGTMPGKHKKPNSPGHFEENCRFRFPLLPKVPA